MNKKPWKTVERPIATAAFAVAAMFATAVHAGGFDGKPVSTNDWFDVSFTSGLAIGSTIDANSTTGITLGAGSWTAVPADGTVEVVADGAGATTCLDISTDVDDLLTLTPVALSSAVSDETVAVEVNAIAVSDFPETPSSSPITAFTLYDNGTTVIPMAYVAGGWTNLVYSPGAQYLTNAWITLYLDFSNVNGDKYVRYSVKPAGGALTVLQDSEGETWFPAANSSSERISSLSFGGSGLCRTISGDFYYDELVEVDGSKTITLTSNLTIPNLSVTNVTDGGTGTLTVSSSNGAKLIVGNLDIGEGVVVNMANIEATTITGSGTAVYTSCMPPTSVGWTDASAWNGTVTIENVTNLTGDSTGSKFDPNSLGNTGSTLELNNCQGWLPWNYECSVPLKVTGTLTINNGYSGANNAFTIDHLKGGGTIWADTSAATVCIRVREWSGFAGRVRLTNKVVVFGEDPFPSALAGGRIIISTGATVTNRCTDTWTHWEAAEIIVNGTFVADKRSRWSAGTPMLINSTGTLELTSTGEYYDESDDTSKISYANVTGTGTIKFNGTGWRGFPYTSPADTLSIVPAQSNGLVFRQSGKTIGSLSGDGNIRSDLGDTGKTFTIKQANKGVWNGIHDGSYDRFATIYVKGGSTSSGELVLAGTAKFDDTLVINDGGIVNLTGTWKGNTTVESTFGGTGTLMGNLAFGDGSTFKAFETDENGLSVSGNVTFPTTAGETMLVDVSGITVPVGGVTLISATGEMTTDTSMLSVAEGHAVRVESNTLKVYRTYTVTINPPAGAVATVTVGGNTVTGVGGVYTVDAGSDVAIAWSADGAYVVSGGTTSITSISGNIVFGETAGYDLPVSTAAVAQIGSKYYATIQGAVDDAAENATISLLTDSAETVNILSAKNIYLVENDKTFGGLTGNGTLCVTNALPSTSLTNLLQKTAWEGTCVISNYTPQIKDFRFHWWGNPNSVVRLSNINGYTGYSGDGYVANIKRLEVVGEGITFNDSFVGRNVYINTDVKGPGRIDIKTNQNPAEIGNMTKFIFTGDLSEYTGEIKLNSPTSAGAQNPAVVFAGKSGDTLPVPTNYGQMFVTENACVTNAGTWTPRNGVSIKGDVVLLSGAAISGSVVLADAGATLTVPTGATAPVPTTSVAGSLVTTTGSDPVVYSVAVDPVSQVEVENVVTPEWKEANGLPAEATTEQIQAKMRELDVNGNAKWENLVLGQDPSASTAVVASTNGTSETAVIGVSFTPPANSGYTVKYALDGVDTNGTIVTSATAVQDTPSIDLTKIAEGETAYFKVRAVLTNDVVGVSVPVEKTIGVTRVASDAEYTIVSVPWASFTDSDIKVSELIYLGNRSAGDKLFVYNKESGDYASGTWRLTADKVWEPQLVTKDNGSSDQATAADLNTIKRGSGVWLQRVDTNATVYLLGQVTNAAVTVELEAGASDAPAWNLVAPSLPTELNLNTGLSITPAANDKIQVPTAGAPITFEYRSESGGWGYMKSTTNSIGIINKAWNTEDAKVPAGRGFWYLNTDSTKKDLGL